MKAHLAKAQQQAEMFRYLAPQKPSASTDSGSKVSYEEHWGKRFEGIKRKLTEGESLTHILSHIRPQRPHLVKGYNRTAGAIAKEYATKNSWPTDSISRLAVADGKYTMVSTFDPLTDIFSRAGKNAVIAELGAGPGWNIFELCNFLGRKARDMQFFAYEYTDAGMKIAETIAKAERLPVSCLKFDFRAPDISALPDLQPALIFTHHAIEQVEDISKSLYEQISKRKGPTTLVHCEPIGWQRIQPFVEARRAGDDMYFYSLIADRLKDLDSVYTQLANSALNSWRCRYNRNALGFLNELCTDKRCREILRLYDFNHAANTNPVNPSTYIVLVFSGQHNF
jgi:hypothetical protein